MTIALRFIPTIIEETEKIMAAQKARGADFTSGSLVKRARALTPVLIPLFISAFRRAGELATAMTCRCYRGGKGRTRLNVLKFSFRDFAALFVIVALGAGVIILNMFAPGYSM
jgi:energy-coupling factor transport system permease protein